jgi:hypothetical protein
MKPSLFYGSAISTCLGLALGLALHGPWADQEHAGGPQILFPSAAAAELARPLRDADIAEGSAPVEQAAYDNSDMAFAYAATDQLPPDSLPVVRLTRMGGPPRPVQEDVQRASTEVASVDADDITTVSDSKDDAVPNAAATPAHPLAYTAIAYTPNADSF